MINCGTDKVLLLAFNSSKNENCLMEAVDESEIIDFNCALLDHGFLLRVLRRICFKVNRGIGIWLGKWKKDIKNYDVCICIASNYSISILKWIRRNNPNIRLINYYWDKIEISKYPIVDSSTFENWGFDKDDSKIFGYKFNPQFYSNKLVLPQRDIKYDISFVAADREGQWKERTKLVKKYYKLFDALDINTFFYYVCNDNAGKESYIHNTRMTESKFLEIVAESKAILDIVDPNNCWFTLRPLLALSNGRKVITNNKNIVNESFYSASNVFILEKDNTSDLLEFISSKFEKIEDDILDFFEVESWIKRFLVE